MKTWALLRKEITLQMFPSGAPENLDARNPDFPDNPSPFEHLFNEGAADISKWSNCEQQNNINLIDFCKTAYKCGMTVIKAPKGKILRVFTVVDGRYCNPVYYRQVEWPHPEFWSNNVAKSKAQMNVGFPSLPMGYMAADASTDSPCGRSRVGVWAIHQGNIYIAPWIQSNERVVIEWDGIKEWWNDDDVVTNSAQDYRKALMLYFRFAYERDYVPNGGNAAMFLVRRPGMVDTGLYADALADLMWQCDQENKVRETPHHNNERKRFVDEQLMNQTANACGNSFKSTFNIPNGANSGTVTGLGLGFTPRIVLIAGVTIPLNGLEVSANPIGGTLSVDGFSFTLDGTVDSDEYVLNYEIA